MTGELNIIKVNLLTAKAGVYSSKEFAPSLDYAGKDGVNVSQGGSILAELPFIPETPFGKLAVGGAYEHSFYGPKMT
ncbi:hypothetical protein [Chitinophaga sancti]|uniref:Uncharacterized protein n=1 Tax=Chitinophaga sancti TaxID=1004 RepID=A0ABZ0XJC5_9BACT|nr:hypothetical protein [Chitinophaga sancti]WQD63620.1 hypothetical protein U0033_04375 [Chitinophaga sancti]WQG90755.1 hypothetical protein SR876_04545 [Chitinophaga sancti]